MPNRIQLPPKGAARDAATLTESFRLARAELIGRQGRPDSVSRRELTALTDSWLEGLWRAAGGPESGATLVAVGGHGRGDLAPGSDLDLLLLHRGADIAQVAERIWYPIWDAGVKLDHSTRTGAEARRLAAKDLRVVLGLLDARVVAGDEAVVSTLRSSVLADWRALANKRLEELHLMVEQRRERFGELAYLLEPDLKEAYGGLRELTVLRAIAASWVTDVAHAELADARATLLDTRDALHRVSRSATDRLSSQERPQVAEALGLADADVVLRNVLGAGRTISVVSDDTWYRVMRNLKPRTTIGLRRISPRQSTDRIPLAEGVVMQSGQVVLAAEARPDRDPVLVLRTAAAAAQAGIRISQHAIGRLAAESAPMPIPWPQEARDALVSLLGAGRNAVPVWESLDQAGLVVGLIPQWAVVRSCPQHNPVHRFTVDRHLLEAAVEASALSRTVRRPDLLLVAALLHDIGKGRAGDHTDIGVSIMEFLAPSMGFDPSDCETLIALVKYHLLLPETATRRDLDDPTTITSVADAVGTAERLELLAALTTADAIAAGPLAWTPWRRSLVRDLVSRVASTLDGAPVPSKPRLTTEQMELAQASTAVDVLIDDTAEPSVVTVAAPDRVGLLGLVAGVLAVNRLAVRGAVTETIGDRAVEVWQVQPLFGDMPAPERLREDIRRALEGRMDIAERLHRRDEAYAAPEFDAVPPPTIEFVAGASAQASVLEVRAHDRSGLLFKVGTAIASCGVDITAARVSTLGSEVIDVFYVVDGTGAPLDAHAEGLVTAAIAEALKPPLKSE